MIATGLVFLSYREGPVWALNVEGTSGVSLSSRARQPIILEYAPSKRYKIAASSHDSQSKLGHLVKDLYYVLDLGRKARTSLPITGLVSPIYTAGLREHGEKATSPVSETGRRLA